MQNKYIELLVHLEELFEEKNLNQVFSLLELIKYIKCSIFFLLMIDFIIMEVYND